MAKSNKKEKITSYISPGLKDTLKKYSAKNKMSESEIIKEALLQFFKVKTADDNLDYIVSVIENTIHKELDSKTNRILTLLAKSTKSTYSSQYLQAYVLAYLFNRTDEAEFLKEKIELADELGYKATKAPLSENFIDILPKDLKFDNIV